MEIIPPPVPPGLEGRETVPPPEDQFPPELPEEPLLPEDPLPEDPLLEDPLLDDPLLEDPLLPDDPLLVEEVPFLYPVQEVEHEAYLAQ